MAITIHHNDFSNFLRCLSLLKDVCNDVEIHEGILRQRINAKSYVFEMDLSPLVSDCDIVLSNVKQTLPLLRGLSGQQVRISSTDKTTSFSGTRSTIKFDNPRQDFLDNKFIPSEELANVFKLREEDVMLEYYIGKETSKLMKVIRNQFNVVNFQVSFEEDAASITATTKSKDQYSRIEHGIPLKRPFKGLANIDNIPFLVDHDGEILFKMYKVEDTVCANKFKTLVGEITVVLYGKSPLIKENE